MYKLVMHSNHLLDQSEGISINDSSTGWAKIHIGFLTFKIFFIVVVIIMKFQSYPNKFSEFYLYCVEIS